MAGLRPSINEIRKFQYASMYRWGFSVVTMPRTISVVNSSDLAVRAYSSTIPKVTVDQSTVENRGQVIWQPGITRYPGTHTLVFHEAEDGKMAKFLNDWHQQHWKDDSGVQELTNDIKGDFKLSLLNSKDTVREEYILHGCWLQDWDGGELSSTSSDTLKYTLTLQYDYFTFNSKV